MDTEAQWKHMNRRLDGIEEKLDSLLYGEEPKDIYHRAVGVDPVQGEGSDRSAWGIQGAYVTTSQPNQRWEHVDPSVAPDPGSWITARQMAEIDERFATYEEGRIHQMNEWSERNLSQPPYGPPPGFPDELQSYGDYDDAG